MTGDGTAENPYTVASVSDFRELDGKSGYVIMTADVDFNSGGNVSFSPIISSGELFFDGKGHKIENFYQYTSDYGGLFKNFSGTFENCNIENAYILSVGRNNNIGIISNNISSSDFSNVTVTGMINAIDDYCNTGGFGGISGGNVCLTNCKSIVNIHANQYAGGFFGQTVANVSEYTYMKFTNCISACRIYEGDFVGGYSGNSPSRNTIEFHECISQCYLEGSRYMAGFTTSDFSSIYINCASICTMVGASDCAYGISSIMKNCVQSYSKCIFDGCNNVYGIGYGKKNQCYAACTLQNVPDGAKNRGVGGHSTDEHNYLTYYDSDIFYQNVDESFDDSGGVTTEQLKSADWLREQGWAI